MQMDHESVAIQTNREKEEGQKSLWKATAGVVLPMPSPEETKLGPVFPIFPDYCKIISLINMHTQI